MKNKKITIKTQSVETLKDVKLFFNDLNNSGISFHPEDSFSDTVFIGTDESTFTMKEAERLDSLMDKCTEICEKKGVDVCEIALIEFRKWEKANLK